MIKKILVLLTILMLSCSAFGAMTQDAIKHEQIRKQNLMTLIDKEIRMLEKLKSTGPTLKFRLVELYAEKIKLLRERENEVLLNSKETNLKVKEKYFTVSNKLYRKMKRKCAEIERAYPHYKQLPLIYYLMAINSRDFDNSKETHKYLLKALKSKDLDVETRKKVNVALAEYYYNEKKYNRAIIFYNQVIKNTDDQWLAKHHYNLSWCYFKEKDHSKAIETLERSYYLSIENDHKYVSVADQSLDAISIFHVNGGKTDLAIDFYLKNLKDPYESLIVLAERASHKGDKTGTRRAIKEAEKKVLDKDYYDLHFRALKIERSFNSGNGYFYHAKKIDQSLKKIKIDKDLSLEIAEEIRSYNGFLQENFFKRHHNLSIDVKKSFRDRIIVYFNFIKHLDPSKISEMTFYQGETHFAINEFNEASNYYIKAIEHELKTTKNKKEIRRSLDALLASVPKTTFKGNLSRKYLVYTYEKFVTIFPVDNVTEQIYLKLMNLYIYEGQYAKAENTLFTYMKNYPKNIEEQRLMTTIIIDTYAKKRNNYAVAGWVKKLRNGHLNFDQNYIDNAHTILGNMIFLDLKKEEKKLSHEELMNKYEAIYNDEHYPPTVTKEAAHIQAVKYLKHYDTANSKKWLLLSNVKDEERLNFATQYMLLEDFNSAIEVNVDVFNKTCKSEIVVALNQMYAALRDYETIYDVIKKSKCQVAKNVIDETRNYNRTHRYFYDRDNYQIKTGDNLDFIAATDAYWKGDTRDLRRFIRITKDDALKLRANNLMEWKTFESRQDDILQFKNIKKIKAILANEQQFDEVAFNEEFEKLIAKLSEYEKNNTQFLNSTEGQVVVGANAHFIKVYKTYGEQINQFIPVKADKNYKLGFQAAMRKIGKAFIKKSSALQRATNKLIRDNEIVTKYALEIK